jgi:hypothetical protein
MGSRIPKEFMLLWFKKITLGVYLEYLSLICRYNGFAEYEVEIEEGDEEEEETVKGSGKSTKYSITLVHDMGEKWSRFLMELIDTGMRNTLGVKPNFDSSMNSVIAKFNS